LARREALGKGIGALFSDQEPEVKAPESLVTTNKSEVMSKEPKGDTQGPTIITKELEVKSPESLVITDKSKVMSKESEVGTHGPIITTNESEVNSPESLVITDMSEVMSKESEVETHEPTIITEEPEVKSPESLVITDKSEVMSKESEVDTQGPTIITEEPEVKSPESLVITKDQKRKSRNKAPKRKQQISETKIKQKTMVIGQTRSKTIDEAILEQAITEAQESPRISTWSPLVMSALRYLQLTTARFSMSREVSKTLETAFREKYPELFESIEKELEDR
jgi:hypothetical protein